MEEAESIIAVLSDEQSREIINLLSKSELTTQQVSNLLAIPQSTAYRKLRRLEELKIIKKTKVVRTLDGLDEGYYKSWTSAIIIIFKEGKLSYSLEHLKIEDKIVRLWQKFSE